MQEALPAIDVEDVSYGEHELQKLDLRLAEGEGPRPLLIWIHGGGFRQGDKRGTNWQGPLLPRCLAAGISCASINYRLSGTHAYPAPMADGARAVQTLRHRAAEWNIDPARVACGGGSAGAGISLWLAFRRDGADPESADPVARRSTRISCALALAAQCSYDPRWIRKEVPGNAYDEKPLKALFGLPSDWDWTSDFVNAALDAKLKDGSPITHLSAGAPPVFVYHRAAADVPGNIHHGNFGRVLEREMKKVGSECVRRMDSDYPDEDAGASDMAAFLKRNLQ